MGAWLARALGAAERATRGLELTEDVTRRAYQAPSGAFGEALLGPPEVLPAVVTRQQGRRRKPGGQEVRFRATVSFTRPVVVDPRDELTLADGFTGPIVDVDEGAPDSTGTPSAATVYMG